MNPRAVLLTVTAVLGLGSGALFERRRRLQADLVHVAAATDSAIAATADARLAAEVDRVRLALEEARSANAQGADAHLALQLGDGLLTLERGDIVFRSTTAVADVPRGVLRVEAVEAGVVRLEGGVVLQPSRTTDSLPPARGTIRIPAADFAAIRPNLKPGLTAFLY